MPSEETAHFLDLMMGDTSDPTVQYKNLYSQVQRTVISYTYGRKRPKVVPERLNR